MFGDRYDRFVEVEAGAAVELARRIAAGDDRQPPRLDRRQPLDARLVVVVHRAGQDLHQLGAFDFAERAIDLALNRRDKAADNRMVSGYAAKSGNAESFPLVKKRLRGRLKSGEAESFPLQKRKRLRGRLKSGEAESFPLRAGAESGEAESFPLQKRKRLRGPL